MIDCNVLSSTRKMPSPGHHLAIVEGLPSMDSVESFLLCTSCLKLFHNACAGPSTSRWQLQDSRTDDMTVGGER